VQQAIVMGDGGGECDDGVIGCLLREQIWIARIVVPSKYSKLLIGHLRR